MEVANQGDTCGLPPAHVWRAAASLNSQVLRSTLAASLNHLVGYGKHAWRKGQRQRLGGFEVYHKLELGGLEDGEFASLFPIEDAPGVSADFAIRIDNTGPIAHETPLRNVLAQLIHSR